VHSVLYNGADPYVRLKDARWAQVNCCLVTTDQETGYLTSGHEGSSTKWTSPNRFGQQAALNSTHGGQFRRHARRDGAAQRRLAFR
jgi:hypothetical protein